MELELNPELESKLSRMADVQGRPASALIQEAIERWVDYDEWFLNEVQQGLAAADGGEFIEHEKIRDLIDTRYPG